MRGEGAAFAASKTRKNIEVEMSVKRIVPNIATTRDDLSEEFYVGLLGLEVGMNLGWIATYISPTNPTVQISVLKQAPEVQPTVSVEVEDVDRVHAEALARGYRIVYPITDEPWGVRRFFVADPSGAVINILGHTQRQADSGD